MTTNTTLNTNFKLQVGTFYVEVWGCQMNVYDGGRIRDLLSAAGYAQASSPKDADIVVLVTCAVRAKADFVKTSTGFSKAGATVEDVKLMRKTVGDSCQVKAAGGIRTYSDAIKMIEAGADRLGCSASIAIVEESEK